MTVTTQRRQRTQLAPAAQSRPQQVQKAQETQANGSAVAASLKASIVGGIGILVLMLIWLIPPPENLPFVSLAFLVIPGYLVVCLATGLLAGIFAGDSASNSQEGGKVGWMAGFWAGVFGGVVAMFMAAFGLVLANFGQGIVDQLDPATLEWLTNFGMNPANIALAGRVMGALVIFGVIGSLVSGLLSSIGGMIYPKLTNPN